MSGSFGIATRTSYVAAILLVFLMLGIPSFFMNGGGFVGNAAADGEDVDRNFTIAVSELTVDTLNPNTYTMSSEGLVIFPLYSYLLQYDVDTNVMGDAAREWSHSADGLLWNFKLWDNIYFIDPASEDDLSHQLTGADVIWTFWNCQNRTDGRLYSYFPGILEAMWTSPGDPLDLWIQLNTPFASIQDSWIGMPLLPKYYWLGNDYIDFLNSPPIGSGPFYYKADNDPDIGTVMLCRNDHWHATENFGWQVHADNIVLKEELSDDIALQAITDGSIDVWMRVSPTLFLDTLPSLEDVGRFSYTAGFVYEYNLNQMTDALREELGGGFVQNNAYNNQQLLLEPVRDAMAMCVDKPGFVDEVQYGLGDPACSLIPQDNPWHWDVPEDDAIQYNPALARDILNVAGYVYDKYGNYDPDATPLSSSTEPDATNTLSFRFYTLDTSADWEYGSLYLAEAAALAGVELNLEIKSVSYMNTIWYSANYDVWLWDWDMGVLGDGAGIMEVLTSMSIGTSSDVYWVNETYDSTYTQSLYCMDPVYRHELIDQLQIMAYEQKGCQCVAYSANNYGVSTKNWDIQSLGDWNSTYELLPDVNYQWLAMGMYPNNNHAPYYQMVTPDIEDAEVGIEEDFMAVAKDDGDNGLLYRWFWGDGEKTDWSSSGNATHAFEHDGVFDVWVAAREDGPSEGGYHDNFTTSYRVTVTVRDSTNDAPTNPAFSWDLTAPDTGDVVTFSGTASDEEGDELFYSWDFGGGHWLDGVEVSFQFPTEGYQSVTMYVTDNHIGTGERPVSTSQTIEVRQNYPPTIDVPTYSDIPAKQTTTYTVVASDPEETSLLYTWYWGDGGVSVTTGPSTTHMYEVRGTYSLTVWVDDLTGVDGHNVSGSDYVYVYNPAKNNAPVIESFTASDTTPYTGQVVSFPCSATDKDGDALTFTVAFGDGSYAVKSFSATGTDDPISWTATHVYTAAGTLTPTARLYVSDGLANTSSSGISLTVSLNNAPTVVCSDVYGDTGSPTSFTVVSEDYDGDTLSYIWDWDDETTSTTSGPTTTHTYAASDEYVYRVYVSDGKVETSDAASAFIDAIPSVVDLIDFSYAEDLNYTFTADGSDPDGDDLTYTWDFGDGTVMVGKTVVHQYADPNTYIYTVYVDDGFPLPSHNVSASGEITIGLNVATAPELQDLPEMSATVDELVIFTATATDLNGDPITYEWNFGDLSPTEPGQTVTHTYTAVANYTYSVTASDGILESSKSNTIHILADAAPVADAGPDQTADQDESVTFDGSGSSDDVDIVSYVWTISDLSVTLTVMSPMYAFSDAGVYTVSLEVTDTIGQTDTDEVVITVSDTTDPIAVPTATPDPVDMGGTITLSGAGSTDNVAVVSWAWSFYDGADMVDRDGVSVDYVFDYAGVYTVTLTVADAAGNMGTDSIIITVTDTEDPVADAGVDQSVFEGDTVTFNGTESTDNIEVVNWTWSFVYDSVSELVYGETAEFVFGIADTYTVTLTVRDAEGNTATGTMTVTVTVLPDAAPVAVAAIDSPVTVGDTVTFDGTGSSDDNDIVSWIWTFDDNGVPIERSGETQTYVFDIAGTYEITLTVTDSADQTDVATVSVTVEAIVPTDEAPVAVAAIDSPATVGDTVTFDGTGSSDDNEIVNWTWSFDDNGVPVELYGETATYVFETVGTYEVTLTVTDDADQTDVATVSVTVEAVPALSDPPVAGAGTDQTVVIGAEVEFSGALSSDDVGVVNYTWSFSYNGSVVRLYGVSPSFTFHTAATYTVTLTVTDADGQEDTDTVTVTVNPADTTDDKTFIESYGLPIALLAIIVVAALAFMLMKRKKGGKSTTNTGLDGTTMDEPQEPSQ